jgi:hypothetical protein
VPALAIEVGWRRGVIGDVAIHAQLPAASALLAGQTPAAALAMLSRLYAVCGRAQRACAEFALDAAGAAPPLAAQRRAELARAVATEAVQEHLWRLLLDWPRQLGAVPRQPDFARWYRRLSGPTGVATDEAARTHSPPGLPWPEALLREIESEWLAAPLTVLPEWAELGRFDAWVERGATSLAQLFARLALAARELEGPGPAAATGAMNPAAESGPLARHAEQPWLAALLAHGRHLEAQLAARLVAVTALAAALVAGNEACAVDADSPAPGRGVALVDTARGVLVHDVTLTAGRIAAYTIRTPTEHHFAAHGPFVGAIDGRRAASAAAAARLAGLWALAFDPCVPWRVSLAAEAGHA